MGDTEAESKLLSAVTGIEYEEKELDHVGERIFNLQRAIMVREGRTRNQDTLHPSYFEATERKRKEEEDKTSVAIISSDHSQPIARQTFEEAKAAYYEIRGWDIETGHPTGKTLKNLGLVEISDQLNDAVK
jgi:aldehyde:ferredoxin oxidoreductase